MQVQTESRRGLEEPSYRKLIVGYDDSDPAADGLALAELLSDVTGAELLVVAVARAGWYSWDHLDNGGSRSAERIHPEWQPISIGDHFASKPDGSTI